MPDTGSGWLRRAERVIHAAEDTLLITLLGAMRKHSLKRGVAALCIGGGEATAMALELL